MAARNRTGTIRMPVSLDVTTNRVLEDLARLGMFGKNRAEVALSIIRTWIWENEQKLDRQGVVLAKRQRATHRKAT